ncbi:hypothetical protein LCGC14_1686410, partial [marine sediment metagenome]
FLGRGATKAGVSSIEAGRVNRLTAEALRLSAQGLVLQGDIEIATDTLDQAIEIEFADAENFLKFRSIFLEKNKQDFSQAQKARAEIIQRKIKEEQRLLAERKLNVKETLNLALEVAENNPDNPEALALARRVMREDALRTNVSSAFDLLAPFLAGEEAVSDKTLTVLDLVRIKELYGITPPPNSTLADIADIISSGDFPVERPQAIQAETQLKGLLTKSQLARLELVGVPLDIASGIVKLILQGVSNDKIRGFLQEKGHSPRLLDDFDRTVGIDKIRNVSKTGGASTGIDFSSIDISKLLEAE